jgi:uncharacterized protein
MLTADKLIELLQLEPLAVEGGYFRRTHLADEVLPPGALRRGDSQARALSSGIYYLLTDGLVSSLHRLLSDEIYHFYLGDPVEMLLLHPNGTGQITRLGQDIEAGQQVQFRVPRGVWQGAHLCAGGHFALMGTSMAPAWDANDFELGGRATLSQLYPAYRDLIEALTPS